jgi:hypothetical protein
MASQSEPQVIYRIVEHDGGWAYKVGGVFSETFANRNDAVTAARRAADEQELSGETHDIEYQDSSGEWRQESSRGDDRPETEVEESVERLETYVRDNENNRETGARKLDSRKSGSGGVSQDAAENKSLKADLD